MSLFHIKTEVLRRFSRLSNKVNPNIASILRLEKKDGKIYAISTNEEIAIIEMLGTTDDENEVVHIKYTEKLLDYIEKEYKFDSFFTIETNPETAEAILKTSLLNSCSDCFLWLDDTPLNDWELWLNIDEPESKGCMYCELYQIQMLFETSPTGKILFPKNINVDKPIVVRDVNNENWVGVFIPKSTDKLLKTDETPKWLRSI